MGESVVGIFGIMNLFCGVAAGALAHRKGQSTGAGIGLGLLLGPIGIIAVALFPSLPACPACGTRMLNKTAYICPACNRDIRDPANHRRHPPR